MQFSESALYRHFQNKEAIIVILIEYLSENINTRFNEIIKSNKTSIEKLSALFDSQFQYFKANPHFLAIILSDALMEQSEEIKKHIQHLMNMNSATFKQLIEKGQDEGSLTKKMASDEIVHVLMGSFRMQMLKWKMANYTFDLELSGNQIMQSVIQLIKKKSKKSK